MKRCPLCDFIYEQDQLVCDMDGIELVHDGGVLTPAGEEPELGPAASAGSPRRSGKLRLLLASGVGAALFSAYYLSVNQSAPADGGQASASYAARPAAAAAEPTPAPAAPTPAATPAETPTPPAEKATPTPAPAPAAPAPEPRAAGASGKKPRPASGNKKKESKLESILNKTGRMLKKPFGF